MEADAEGQVKSREHQQSPEPRQQQEHQADLEYVGVEHHQQDDDHVEQDGNVLDAVDTDFTGLFVIKIYLIYIYNLKDNNLQKQIWFKEFLLVK